MARILEFEYLFTNEIRMIDIHRRAQHLLYAVTACRSELAAVEQERPIVFIGVGFGGAIIKEVNPFRAFPPFIDQHDQLYR